MQRTTSALLTKRVVRNIRPLPTRFVDFSPTDTVTSVLGHAVEATAGDRVRLFLVGPRPAGRGHELATWAELDRPDWTAGDHHLDLDAPVLRYVHESGGRVEILRSAPWFGNADRRVCVEAWERLGEELRSGFNGCLMSTPGTTGRDLFVRSIPPRTEYPVLADELREWIRTTSGQGRTELLDAPDELELDYSYGSPRGPGRSELHVLQLDGRLMYAALCWKLPAGAPVPYRASDTFDPMARGRYRVRATVPRYWSTRCECGAPGHARIGILPLADAGRWSYPSEPGRTFETVADGAELYVARRHGWRFEILDGWTWPNETRPLDTWVTKLARTYFAHVRAAHEIHARNSTSSPHSVAVHEALRTAYRAMVLHTIGQLHGAPRQVTRTCPVDDPVGPPAGARSLRVDGDRLVWIAETPPAWPELAHPEWSSTVYARARARLLHGPRQTGALCIPAEHVVAFATDAVYLTRNPHWDPDVSDAAGTWRIKQAVTLDQWPTRWSELREESAR